jgi:hypothetical protein
MMRIPVPFPDSGVSAFSPPSGNRHASAKTAHDTVVQPLFSNPDSCLCLILPGFTGHRTADAPDPAMTLSIPAAEFAIEVLGNGRAND